MKKPWVVVLIALSAIFITVFIIAVIISFKVVKQTTDKINFALKSDLQPLVRIPEPIPPETKSFEKTIYIWEMETKEGEVTKVRFTHDTAFSKKTEKINATLEMEPGADPSLFNKVLPAVIADRQTIVSATDPTKMNLSANSEAGYNKIELTQDNKSQQTTKINWEFNKEVFTGKNKDLYQKINNLPEPMLVALYKLQRVILETFSN